MNVTLSRDTLYANAEYRYANRHSCSNLQLSLLC
jgi:hypothetical protein